MSDIERFEGFKYRGHFYESEADAKAAKARWEFKKWLETEGVGGGGDWDTEMIAEHIISNFEKYLGFLNKFY